MADDLSKMVADWCSSVIDTLRPESVLIVGSGAEELVDCFLANNVPAVSAAWNSPEAQDLRRDVAIFHFGGAAIPELQAGAFAGRFGSPRVVLALVPFAEGGVSLPEVTHWLMGFGYAREMNVEKWLGPQFFTAIYHSSPPGTSLPDLQFEAEWWRLAQINQKQRLLLAEYMTELNESAFQLENLKDERQRIVDWARDLERELLKRQDEYVALVETKAKWDAFEATIFGKLWVSLRGMKHRIVR